MNISGIVVKAAPENISRVIETLKASGLCEVHFTDNAGKIVVTLEGKDTNEEIRKLREIMNLPDVLCANLAYSYNEDEMENDLGRIERKTEAVPDALNSFPADP